MSLMRGWDFFLFCNVTAVRAADWANMTPSLSLLARDEIIHVLLCCSVPYTNLRYSCTVTSTGLLVNFYNRLWHGSTKNYNN